MATSLTANCRTDILSDACAQDMQDVCAVSSGQFWSQPQCYANPTQPGCTPEPHSIMLDPRSACFQWRNALLRDQDARMQTTNLCWDFSSKSVNGVWQSTSQSTCSYAPTVAYNTYDYNIQLFCSGSNSALPECACSAFPNVMEAWCAYNKDLCTNDLSACAISEMVVNKEDGVLETIQFSDCTPLECWYQGCNESPAYSLVPTSMRRTQLTTGGCPMVCLNESGVSTVSVPHVQPVSNQVVNIASGLIQECSSGGPPQPALLSVDPITFLVPQNWPKTQPLTIVNDGDFPTQYTILGSTSPLVSLADTSLLIGARNGASTALVWNVPNDWAVGSTLTSTLTLQYSDGVHPKPVTSKVVSTLQIDSPRGAVVEIQNRVPPMQMLFTFVLLCVALVFGLRWFFLPQLTGYEAVLNKLSDVV